MDDPFAMRLGDGPSQGLNQPGRIRGRSRRAVQCPIETAAGEVLQLEERQATRVADVVDLHDAGVPQARDRFGLGAEPRHGRRPGMQAGQDHLERAGAVECHIACQVDDSHAAAAQLAEDLIAGRPQRLERGGVEISPRQSLSRAESFQGRSPRRSLDEGSDLSARPNRAKTAAMTSGYSGNRSR